jgi:hypothetical protein
MTVLEKISHLKTVWRLTLPHIPEPSHEDVARWCIYPMEHVEAAILRTVRRFAKDKLGPSFVPTEAYRYTSAVARSMTEKAQPTQHELARA